MQFDPLKDNFSLPAAEERILALWDKHQIFRKAGELAKDRPHFVFYEGPPTANGKPGIHHIGGRGMKDMICRYKAMQGFRVDRKGGWDTHGLPVEIEVEKQLKLESKADVVKYGVARFNQKCRDSVFTYLDLWNNITRRTGFWLDLDDAYVTLRNDYIETVWWILKQFFDRDLIYQGFKTVPFCPRCETGLSSHEVAQGYQVVKDPSVYVKAKAADDDFSYLIWTTTPWTLPSNAALCMSPEATYVMVEHEGDKLVLAEALVEKVFGQSKPALQKYKGSDFLKRRYVPLFDTFKEESDRAFFVVNGDFVTMEDGTGIVHVAPGFGTDDYEVGKKFGLPVFQAIEANGVFKSQAGPYAGMFIKDADPLIIKDLKIAGKLFKKEQYEHNYPFCWRCTSPLIYIARQSWYLKTTQFREQLVKNNNAINWYPDEIRTGRMGNWLEGNVDWALSRERFWGTPIPIWVCDDDACGHMTAVGSIEQLRAEGQAVPDEVDLHKPMVDQIKLTCDKCGSAMTRIPEVVDVWFDSGSMPYAQWHYPFENKGEFEIKYPCDFISEGVDQTRGWFYSLLTISTILFDKPPFRNVIVQEMIQDKDGKKMSKSRGNAVDPFATVDKFGADPTRWYLISASMPWVTTKFDPDGLAEVVRKYFDTLRNTYSFFALYANIDNIVDRAGENGGSVADLLETHAGPPEVFDRWIVSRYNSLIKEVTAHLDGYQITQPLRAIQNFVIEDLSNWYVRNNRRRFWAKGDDPSKMRAYLTLYKILVGLTRLTAPATPMVSELFYRQLMGVGDDGDGSVSVHFTSYPIADEGVIDTELEQTMALVALVVSLGRAARSRKNLKVRQPLSGLLVALPEGVEFERIEEYLPIIRAELNVKKVERVGGLDQHISYRAKLNFKSAGPKLGAAVKQAAAWLGGLASNQVREFAAAGEILFESGGASYTLTLDDIEVLRDEMEGFAVETEAGVSVALLTELTDELVSEGLARELINKIQNSRKKSGCEVTDWVHLKVATTDTVRNAAEHEDYRDFILRETLTRSIDFVSGLPDGALKWDVNGHETMIHVSNAEPTGGK
ncbi:MAG: isoleucine--tRNA ligase [bacterium]